MWPNDGLVTAHNFLMIEDFSIDDVALVMKFPPVEVG